MVNVIQSPKIQGKSKRHMNSRLSMGIRDNTAPAADVSFADSLQP